MTDHELLAGHLSGASPEAFAELVQRHLPLVLSAARRRLLTPDLAEDVAQQVFTLLARKASSLGPRVVITGWLYQATCHIASELNRNEGRRQIREHESMAITETTPVPPEAEVHWRQIRPVLDDALQKLSEADRNALLLRFFEGRSLEETGQTLGVTAETAQKRVSRALDRLRRALVRHHPWLTHGTLAAAIGAGMIEVVPTSGQAAAIAQTAIAASGLTSATISTAGTTLLTMASTKSVITTVVTAALLGVVAWQYRQLSTTRAERNHWRQAAEASAAVESQAAAPPEASKTVDPELLRLRGEVARLRGLSNEVVKKDRELAALRASRPPAVHPAGVDAEEQQRIGILKMNYVKGWVNAAYQYCETHNGQMPKSFEEIANLFPGELQTQELNPDQFEFTYQGRIDTLGEPNKYIVAREKDRLGMRTDRGYARVYAFGDGHSELHFEVDGNFENWEAEHTPPPNGKPPTGGVGAH